MFKKTFTNSLWKRTWFPLIEIENKTQKLNTLDFNSKKNITIRFINHACIHVEIDNKFSFATDPWIIGSAFCNGWWLAKDSPIDAFEVLNNSDFIYISHNHPDHLHRKSLEYLRKDMPILTAGFTNKSTLNLLKEFGFRDITTMDFSSRFVQESNEFSIALLKSGDFREDSGLLFEIGEFTGLLTVDSNLLNFGKLPDVIFSPHPLQEEHQDSPCALKTIRKLKKRKFLKEIEMQFFQQI